MRSFSRSEVLRNKPFTGQFTQITKQIFHVPLARPAWEQFSLALLNQGCTD